MKSFSKLLFKYDNNCCVEITNASGISKNGWVKFDNFIKWFSIINTMNKEIIEEIDYSNNLINVKEDGNGITYQFMYNTSVRDLQVYQKGKYVHKTIYLPNIIAEININEMNNWNTRILAFTGDLNYKTQFYALNLPHFYKNGSLCLGNLNTFKKINSIKEMDQILNFIFSTKFVHEWTNENNLFCTPAHFIKGLAGLANYSPLQINNIFN